MKCSDRAHRKGAVKTNDPCLPRALQYAPMYMRARCKHTMMMHPCDHTLMFARYMMQRAPKNPHFDFTTHLRTLVQGHTHHFCGAAVDLAAVPDDAKL
jgi:hypothetical protein